MNNGQVSRGFEPAPTRFNERIAVLDVLRGFALMGILLMNIELFNRVDHAGILPTVHGLDRWASYFVNYFITGNFRTLFSLLFGMGFAVMLNRFEENGRAFLGPYLRRLFALAMFGILHSILLWEGDILLSYAFCAAVMLVILFVDWKWIILTLLVLVGLVVGLAWPDFLLTSMLVVSGVALLIRGEKTLTFLGLRLPLFALIFGVSGALSIVLFALSFLMPSLVDFRQELIQVMAWGILSAYLAMRFLDHTDKRLLSVGIFSYILPLVMSIAMGIVSYQEPMRNVFDSPAAQKLALKKNSASGTRGSSEAKSVLSAEQIQLEQDADMINRILAQKSAQQAQVKLLAEGSYWEILRFHLEEFLNIGYLIPIFRLSFTLPLFLLGVWAVRSGMMTHTSGHLALFKRLALIGLPLGFGMSLFASSIAVGHVEGVSGDGWDVAHNIVRLSNLPTTLAYLSIVVLMFHSASFFSKIRILGAYGRMALTNYLMQTLVLASLFFGWGGGYFGMARAEQLGLALIIICVQIGWSHWWLARFRYGPAEWVWRAVTYWTFPKMRI